MEENEFKQYVRTDKGFIGIVKEFDNSYVYSEDTLDVDIHNIENAFIERSRIVKCSKNIIDLIEVGDYVNGKLIHHTDIRKNSAYIYYGNGKTFVDYQIENVVTKEQFESIKYEVIK